MKAKLFLILLGFLLICSACSDVQLGTSTSLSPSGRSMGTCLFTGPEAKACLESIHESGSPSVLKKLVENECKPSDSSGQLTTRFSSTGCSTSNATSYCTIQKSVTAKGETFSLRRIMVFYSPMPESTIKQSCDALGGLLSTTQPSF